MIDKHKAMTPMSLEESIEVLATMPERILPSRFRQRKKPVDQVDVKENPEFAFPLNNDNNDGSKAVEHSRVSMDYRRFPSSRHVWHCKPRARHHSFKRSTSSSLRPQGCARLVSVTWRRRSFEASV